MKQKFLAAILLLFIPAIAAAADYRSSFGFPFSLSDDWTVVTPETVSKEYKNASLDSAGLADVDTKTAKSVLAKVKGGKIEYYFEKKDSAAGFTNNISVQLSPGGGYPVAADVKQDCKKLAKNAAAIQHQPVKVNACGMKRAYGIPYVAYEYAVPGRKLTLIQREVPFLPTADLLIVGGSNDAGLDTVRKNTDSIVASIMRYLAKEKKEKVLSAHKQLALVRRSMHDFALAVNARDFTKFYHAISLTWQQVVTVPQLDKGFKAFMDHKINLLPLDHLKPRLKFSHKRDKDGVLTLKGYYPTKPARVKFQFQYLYEAPKWKLAGASVNLIPAH